MTTIRHHIMPFSETEISHIVQALANIPEYQWDITFHIHNEADEYRFHTLTVKNADVRVTYLVMFSKDSSHTVPQLRVYLDIDDIIIYSLDTIFAHHHAALDQRIIAMCQRLAQYHTQRQRSEQERNLSLLSDAQERVKQNILGKF